MMKPKAEKPTRSFKNFQEFWPYYLSQHGQIKTRLFHFVGTSLAIVSMVSLLATGSFLYLMGALVAGYAPAWISHFFIEKNRPATFKNPFWSLIGDFKMWYLTVTGQPLE
jgi:hypothetical protein